MRWNELEKPSKKELIQMLSASKSLEEIAESNYISLSTLKRWKKYYGLIKPKRNLDNELNISKLVELYQEGYNGKEIGEMFNTSGNKILARIKDKVKVKKYAEPRQFIFDINEIKQLINTGHTTYDIAKIKGCSQGLISKRLKENDIKIGRTNTEKQIKAREQWKNNFVFGI